jgi:sugar phosphate isomerase/epimerase
MLVLSSGTLYKYGLNRIFEFAKETGFDGVEVILNNVIDTRDADYLKQLKEYFGLPIAAFVTPQNNTPKKLAQALELAHALEVPRLIVRSPLFSEARLAHWFRTQLPKLQNDTSVQLCVENPKAGTSFFLPQFAVRSIEDLRRFAHISLDTSHLVSHRLLLLHVYKLINKRVSYIHLSNNFQGKEHWRLEEGDLPLQSFLTYLKQNGYDQPISLKLSLEAVEAGDTAKVKKRLAAAKEFYDRYFVNAEG